MDGGISSDYLHRFAGSVSSADSAPRVHTKNEQQRQAVEQSSIKTLQEDVVEISGQGQNLLAKDAAEKEKYVIDSVQNTARPNSAPKTAQSVTLPQQKSEGEVALEVTKEDSASKDGVIKTAAASATAEVAQEESLSAPQSLENQPTSAPSEATQNAMKSAYQTVENSVNNNSQATEHEIDEVA
ncbi:MAG: hypothetical protein J6M93_05270 [Succinivibrio sp.]|nr:hypothetical protein [Succinivibrio sp.]